MYLFKKEKMCLFVYLDPHKPPYNILTSNVWMVALWMIYFWNSK